MNESCISGMLFCRKCKKLKWNVYDTHNVSGYKFLCDKCASEENVLGTCRSCGREVYVNDLKDKSGLCIYCYSNELEYEVKKLKKKKKKQFA